MRLAYFIFIGLVAVPAAVLGQTIDGPSLGFIPSINGTVIRRVIGIPGAAALGRPVDFGTDISGVVISPNQDYGIGIRVLDRQIVLAEFATGYVIPVAGTRPAGIRPGASIIATSPSASAAAVYDAESNTVQVIRGLPSNPQVIHEFDASDVARDGSVNHIAVSDDGSLALVTVVGCDNAGLWMLDATGASSRLSADRPTAAAFFPNSHDAVFADDATQTAFVIKSTQVPLVSGSFSNVAASADGRRVFLTDRASKTIVIVDMETWIQATVSCECQLAGLYSLKGRSVFRLTELTGDPIAVLDASGVTPRIVIIPGQQ